MAEENSKEVADVPIDRNLLLEFTKVIYMGYAAGGKPCKIADSLQYALGMTKAFQTFANNMCQTTDKIYSLIEGENPKRRVKIEIGKCDFCPFCAYTPGNKEHPNAGLCSVITKDIDDVNGDIPEWCPIFMALQGKD